MRQDGKEIEIYKVLELIKLLLVKIIEDGKMLQLNNLNHID
jgi:hypothetical protein